ncbi:restriction endonuclease subunit S [Streptomyces griseoincarnatus]|uniref:restriction endonuclease subunit S n=1 Tax=Streptomyces sp. OS603R TaxID=3035287 RepID=UPI0024350073|nr:restriction endonuclease subunit S [Streptomyces sp. OS603R]
MTGEPWQNLNIGQLGRVVTGSTPRTGDDAAWGDEIDFVTPTEMSYSDREPSKCRKLSASGMAALQRRVIPAGSTLFVCIGFSTGKVSQIFRPAITNQQVNALIPNPSVVNERFAYYLLRYKSVDIRAIANGSTTPIVNKSMFQAVDVLLPSRREQEAIADVLGVLDDKIAVNERIATTADSMCDLIFQSRAQQCASVPMSQRLHPILGGTPDRKNESYWGGSIPWASAKDVVNATVGVLTSTEEHITETATQNSRAKTLRPGSVVLTARGTVGAVARMAMPAAINQSCYAFEPGRMPAAVLFHMVRSVSKSMLGMAHGTVFSTVNMKTFDHVEIPDFPADVLDSLNGKLVSLHQLVVSHLQESRQLAALRDTLLPQLMSGRLRVKDAEKIVEDAT